MVEGLKWDGMGWDGIQDCILQKLDVKHDLKNCVFLVRSIYFSPSSMLCIMTLIPPCLGSAATLKASTASSSLNR